MSRIAVLPESVSNLIAAGEVVERPASAVKELVENSIDAGASSIRIEIKGAGRRLISVTDNGCGMDNTDAVMCLQPHGTSKIHQASDIDAIRTLGFRGEAIPSIAAVSRLRIRTRTPDTAEGVEIISEGGRIVSESPCGIPAGSIFEVRDLFYNVPARKKFLRSGPTEEAHIQETVISLALPHPEIAFELIFDSSTLFHSPAAPDPRHRLAEFFGRKQASEYLELPAAPLPGTGIILSGYIAPMGLTRGSRREQRFFVNGRAVEASVLYRGVRDGYGERCEAGRFPPVVLFLSMPPEACDINVHPTKREIRFRDESGIAPAIAKAISARLGESLRSMVRFSPPVKTSPEQFLESSVVTYMPETPQENLPDWQSAFPPPASAAPPSSSAPAPRPAPPEQSAVTETPRDAGSNRDAAPVTAVSRPPLAAEAPGEETRTASADAGDTAPEKGEWRFIGIFNALYIIVEADGELRLIDQHAAHERVLFEKFQDQASGKAPVQQLLLPVQVELDKKTFVFFERHGHALEEFGFDLSRLSSQTLMVNGIPAALPASADVSRVITDIFDTLIESGASGWISVPRDEIARAACHSAIKGSDRITETEAVALIEALRNCRRPDCCPHGRPTMIRITGRELARRFGRV